MAELQWWWAGGLIYCKYWRFIGDKGFLMKSIWICFIDNVCLFDLN